MTQTRKRAPGRVPLSRELVLDTAVKLADQGGLESLSMRKLGQELGVEAMALYYHFANKDEALLYSHSSSLARLIALLEARPSAESAWTAVSTETPYAFIRPSSTIASSVSKTASVE